MKIIGASIVSSRADELIHEFLLVMLLRPGFQNSYDGSFLSDIFKGKHSTSKKCCGKKYFSKLSRWIFKENFKNL